MRVDVTPSFRELAPIRAGIVPNEQSVFVREASELLSSVLELEKLLSQVRPKYLLPKRFVRTKGSRMSEEDKDELDADLVELIKNCSSRIDVLKSAADVQPAVASVKEFRKEVVAYLLERLKCTADSAKQMQKKRYQQPFLLSSRLLPEDDRQGLDALEKTIVRLRHVGVTKKQIATMLDKNTDAPAIPSSQTSGSPALSTCASSALSVNAPLVEQTRANKPHRDILNTRNRTASVQQPPLFASQSDELELTEEEGRRFAVENVILHRHFQENLEDAKKMESKMAEISSLMGQFADKIMEQQSDIEQIQHHAYETKSNVSQSNRILEQTQGIGNGYGFLIFCFYAGFSVILHMLHYFNS
uniref:t-SNARE coiled-coil homology domain-containing protein n=1 Tax=Peronospora matthiolae TaxID=2874970 RepID=A0AAV1VAE8_9STRA